MNVAQCVQAYLGHKHACGYACIADVKILRRFVLCFGKLKISLIADHHIDEFLSRMTISNNTWQQYSDRLRRFFVFCFIRQRVRRIPKPKMKPGTPRTFYPHVYTRAEIRKLLDAAVTCQRSPHCTLGPETLKTIVLLLYGTGMKMREAVATLDSDVDFANSEVRLRGTFRRRVIPIGRDVKRLLRRHLESDERTRFGSGRPLFLTMKGTAVQDSGFCKIFRRLRNIAGVERTDGTYQPRVYDLRHTFAVHSIAHWDHKGIELERTLPLLAAYMGNVDLTGVERYLDLSPCRYRSQLGRLKV